VVFQDFLRLPFTARENIGCGSIERLDDLERVRQAARRAGADAFIEQLPLGYETMLSKQFDQGHEPSYGQWQRVCLARLFAKDAAAYVFDEPTASLDIEAEVQLLREIDQLSRGHICVLISHRAVRPGIADRCVLMAEGRIIEAGDYDSLLRRGGEFARLARLYQKAGPRAREGDEATSVEVGDPT
jgi:ABC-type multidrug transport system fused ATPase/permease subunit